MDLQILVIVVVVVLSILDAVMKKAKKRGLELPQSDEPAATSEVEQGHPPPVPGPDAASRPSTAGPPSAGRRQSALDILVPPEIRKELEDLVSGGGPRAGQTTSPPTQASGSGELSGTSMPSDRRSLPAPSEASASSTADPSWEKEGSLGEWLAPDHGRSAPQVEVRSRVPRPLNVHAPEPRPERRAVPSVPTTPGSPARPHPPLASRLGFSTMSDLRRNIVAREILGAPVALRDDGQWRGEAGSRPLATPLVPPPTSPEPPSSPPSTPSDPPTPKPPQPESEDDKTPISVGGKRRDPHKPSDETPANRERLSGFRRPELRCRETSDSHWEVVVDLPNAPSLPKILLDGQQLPTSDRCCPLPSLDRNIVAVLDGGSTVELLTPGLPLIFKTAKHWKSGGRRVGRVTRGYFVVIVPEGWRREGPPPPVAPTKATAPGYQAHYEYWDGRSNDRVRFAGHDLPMANDIEILKGSTLFDDDLDHGPLFVGDPPRLTNSNAFAWAMVGEEGVPDGWRCRFKPSKHQLADLLEGREGWFFVRLYDANVALQASTDFRYSRCLAQIHVNNQAYSGTTILLPAETGHDLTRLAFIDRTGSPVNPWYSRLQPTVVDAIADKHADDVRVELRSPAGRIPVRVQLPRLWWRLVGDDTEHDWQSTAFRWVPQEYHRLAEIGTTICLDMPRHVPDVSCGFDGDTTRRYRRSKSGYFEIPLDEFLDELDDFFDEHAPHVESRDRIALGVTSNLVSRNVPIVHVHREPVENGPMDYNEPMDIPRSEDDDHEFVAVEQRPPPPDPITQRDCEEFLVCHCDSHDFHSWEEARSNGVVNIPYLTRFPMGLPSPGSRLWVCLSGRGYVGVGIVANRNRGQPQRPATKDGPWTTEVPVDWYDTLPETKMLFGPEIMLVSAVVPIRNDGPKCRETVEALKTGLKWRIDA